METCRSYPCDKSPRTLDITEYHKLHQHIPYKMRQRITYFHKPENGVEPASLTVSGRSISGPDIIAEREDRITLALEELPIELQHVLREAQELYVRWQKPTAYKTIGPWSSRLPPGLHAFYTPIHSEKPDGGRLCRLFRTAFGPLDCSSTSGSFTKLPNDRFSHSTAYQFYHILNDLTHFSTYLEQYVCASGDADCKTRAQRLLDANSVDLSYDAISRVVKVTSVWPHKRQPLSIESHPSHRAEVGIMTSDVPAHLESHEVGVAGLLTVLGEDGRPAPTLFSFPSRHKTAPRSSFSSNLLRPWGLHPTMQLKISTKPPMEDAYCSLHSYLTLPRTIFADKYQLGDELFLQSKNLSSLRYISQPVDLEAPSYAMNIWGSSVLLELQPQEVRNGRSWTAEIPLHLRYLAPAEQGYRNISVPWPVVFWACTAEDGTKFPNSPFDRVNLGYDGLFGPRTLFWHVDAKPSEGENLYHDLQVPVLDLGLSNRISSGTATVVLMGLTFVIWKLVTVCLGMNHPPASPKIDRSRRRSRRL
ncbi:PIG-X-domain-containing protein [Hypoxylon trugodes]|uniref:PIG-X-domain-containing protein n=1 Tax=Hypoxylon trugodes TaxID=326681 RepID=UPI00219FD5E7|nr:PIG-X-domain-containing protein [Hypoxylon trugodes]KAI1393519.1 PIG-X-domain-containing protein [Hypoxylon trugodes]